MGRTESETKLISFFEENLWEFDPSPEEKKYLFASVLKRIIKDSSRPNNQDFESNVLP